MASQIEYRATIDKATGENSDLPLPFIKQTLMALEGARHEH